VSGGRNTIILCGLLGILAAYFFVFEAGKNEVEEIERVFDLEVEAVTQIKITTESGSTVVEKVPLEGWQIVDPLRYPADVAVLRTLLNEFATLSPARTVADSAADLSEYGLDFPSVTVKVSSGLSAPNVLLVGDLNPTGSSYYAAAQGSQRVFFISRGTNNHFRKSVEALRDRLLVHFDKDKVDEFVIQKRGERIVGKLDSIGTWRIHEPFKLPAERNEAISLIGNMHAVKALTFVDDAPKSLKPYGLDRPAVTATVKSRDGQINQTISLGNVEGNSIYILSSERKTVYSVSSDFLSQINRDSELFRRKTAFSFRSYEVPKMSMQLGDESVSLVKRSFEDWRMTSPFDMRANDHMINSLLDSLEVMWVRNYIPASAANVKRYGLDRAPIKLSLIIENRPVPQDILIGAASEDGRTIYVQDPLEEWIYEVSSTGVKNIPATALDVRDKKILRFKGYQVHMFEVILPDFRVRVRRDQKQKTVWKMEAPVSQNADAVSVGRAFDVMDSLYAEVFITADPDADMASFGLDRPYLEVTMQIGGRDDVPEERLSLLVGKPFPGDRRLVYIKLRNNPVVSLVNSGFVEHLKNMAAATTTS